VNDARGSEGADRSPYDGDGGISVPNAAGWRYLLIAPDGDDTIAVTLEGPDRARVRFTVPAFLSRGEELGEVARIVIRARDRMDRSAGLGA
jgi:hypothetical protein